MKHTDEQIREIFTQKLGEFESEVSPHLWDAVSSQIGSAAGTTAAAAGAKLITTKLLLVAAVTVATIVGVALYVANNDDAPVAAYENTQQTTIANPENTSVDTNTSSESTKNVSPEPQHSENVKVQKQTPGADEAKKSPSLSGGSTDPNPPYFVQDNRVQNPPVNEPRRNETGTESANDRTQPPVPPVPASEPLNAEFNVRPVDMDKMVYSFQAGSKEAASYLWDFGDGTTSTEANPQHTFSDEGDFNVTLRVYDEAGKEVSTTHYMEVYEPGKVVIPNIFTPNGDGSNDILDFNVKSEGVEFTSIVIRDRNGRTVFESNGSVMWDGTAKDGSPCESGFYEYYYMGVDRNHDILKNGGTVRLIR